MEEILHQAEQSEEEYDWSEAAESYEKALNLLPSDDFSRRGEIQERLAYAFYRFALQAESKEEFRERLRQSNVAYEKASEFYGKLNEPLKTARTSRCGAMIAYIGYWLALEAKEKKKKVDECWKLAKEALAAFKEAGEAWEYGKTYNQLSSSVVFAFSLDWDFQARQKMIREAVEQGEQTIKSLSQTEDPVELGRAYARTAVYLAVLAYNFLDAAEKETGCQKARDYWAEAKETSENVAISEMTWPIFGPTEVLWGGAATDEALKNLGEALECGKKTKNKFNVGCALDWLTYHTGWKALATEDPDEIQHLLESVLRYADDARRHYLPLSFISPRADAWWVEDVDAHNFTFLAYLETDLKKKQTVLEKAMAAEREGLKRAESSGYIEAIIYEHLWPSITLALLADLEKGTQKKKEILQEAMKHGEEAVRMTEQIEPFGYWNRGVMQVRLARIKYGLAELARGTPEEKNMVQEAILDCENALRLKTIEVESATSSAAGTHNVLGGDHFDLGVWLGRLYEITNDRECLRRAIKAFDDAVESFQKVNLGSQVAECQWKAAKVYDVLGEHLEAAESFAFASNSYRDAAEKIPQLKSLYQEHSSYMQAWSEIEKARHYHERQEYGSAKGNFEKAGDLHTSLKKWSYLAPNYRAWASVENAEDLSRKEQCEAAIRAFKEAIKLFEETEKSIQNELSKIEDADEKRMAASMIKASDVRHEYCVARIAIEDAKLLDKKGDHYSSSEKYGSAAEQFEKIGQALESEQEQREMKFITTLSRAWQKMAEAEAEESPLHYEEASQLFENSKDLGQSEKTKTLMLGHSRFCMALEAGARFADTRDVADYASAMQYLESAGGYYLKADFKSASDYVKATRFLLDAYVQMGNAARETDLEKKSRLYMVAEKVLQASADSYGNAGNPSRKEQALKLLKTVQEQREMAISLTEVLHAPIISSTTAFSPPSPTSEKAVGLETFEHAEVNANLIISRRELKVGESLDLEIELANAGKCQALLIQIEGAVPEGFEVTKKPELYRLEGFNLNMKGRRLDPLMAEEVRLSLKSKRRGSFTMRPRILYVDENGNPKSHQPESVIITVGELGIKGWIKGDE